MSKHILAVVSLHKTKQQSVSAAPYISDIFYSGLFNHN